jgi:hypothetical protein
MAFTSIDKIGQTYIHAHTKSGNGNQPTETKIHLTKRTNKYTVYRERPGTSTCFGPKQAIIKNSQQLQTSKVKAFFRRVI